MSEASTSSSMVILCMGVSALISIGLPAALLVLWKKKTKVRFKPFLVGMAVFFVSVMVLESIFHQFMVVIDSPIKRFIMSSPFIYAVYAGLAAGIFEETGRLIAFRFFLNKENGREAGVAYGIGHGGIEAVLLVGIAMINNLVLVLTLNSMGAEKYLSMLPAETADTVRVGLESLYSTPAAMFLVGGIERVFAIAFHIALSVLVFMAVKRQGKKYLYPVAILLHAGVDFFAVLGSTGIIKSLLVIEGIVAIFAAAASVYAYKLYKEDTGAVS